MVKLGDVAPGTGGLTFTAFGAGPYCVVKGLHVIFTGDTGPSGLAGYYSVSVNGGLPRVIANQNTILPGPNTTGTYPQFTAADFQTVFQADDIHVVFNAYPLNANEGVFGADVGGGPGEMLTEIAGPPDEVYPTGTCTGATPPFTTFMEPRIAAQSTNPLLENLAYLGFPPGLGIYYGNVLVQQGLTGTPACMPGITGAIQDIYTQIAIDNEHVYLAEDNGGSLDYVSQVDFDGSNLAPILGEDTPLPGMPGYPYSIYGMTAQFGTLVFIASYTDPTSGSQATALFTYKSGVGFTRVIGTGDSVFGGPSGSVPVWLGENGLSNGNIVFGWRDNGTPSSSGEGIVIAEPAVCAANVSADLKVKFGTPTQVPNTYQWDQTATIRNTGTTTVNGPVSMVLYGLSPFTSSGVTLLNPAGVTRCTGLAPLGNPYVVLNKGQSIAPGQVVRRELQFNSPFGNPANTYTTALFSGAER